MSIIPNFSKICVCLVSRFFIFEPKHQMFFLDGPRSWDLSGQCLPFPLYMPCCSIIFQKSTYPINRSSRMVELFRLILYKCLKYNPPNIKDIPQSTFKCVRILQLNWLNPSFSSSASGRLWAWRIRWFRRVWRTWRVWLTLRTWCFWRVTWTWGMMWSWRVVLRNIRILFFRLTSISSLQLVLLSCIVLCASTRFIIIMVILNLGSSIRVHMAWSCLN